MEKSSDTQRYLISNAVIAALCVFGLVGNVIAVLVFTRKSLRSHSTYTYLAGLAIFDGTFLVIMLPMALNMVSQYSGHGRCPTRRQLVYNSIVLMGCANTVVGISVWTVSAVTFEKYLFIKYPLQARLYCNPRVASLVLTGLVLINCIFHLPYYFVLTVDDVQRRRSFLHLLNSTVASQPLLPAAVDHRENSANPTCPYLLVYTEYATSTGYQLYTVFRVVLINVFPWISTAKYSLRLLSELHELRKVRCVCSARNAPARTKLSDYRLILMLVSVVMECIVTQTISGVAYLFFVYQIFIPEGTFSSAQWENAAITINLADTAGASLNFIFYALINKNFSRQLSAMCKCCACTSDQQREPAKVGTPEYQETIPTVMTRIQTSSYSPDAVSLEMQGRVEMPTTSHMQVLSTESLQSQSL